VIPKWLHSKKLKEKDVAKYYHDRFLMNVLFCRKLDIDRCVELLTANINYRKAANISRLPIMSDVDQRTFDWELGWTVPGSRSKNGNGILYVRACKFIAGQHDIQLAVKSIIWTMLALESERADAHRNGWLVVFDFTDTQFKNVDITAVREFSKVYQDNFPFRYAKILLVEAPFVAKGFLKLCSYFLKPKLIERISIKPKAEVLNEIDAKVLPKHFGGQLDFGVQDFVDHMKKWSKYYEIPRRENETPLVIDTPSLQRVDSSESLLLEKLRKEQQGLLDQHTGVA